MSVDLDNEIDEKSSKKKYLTWTIIAIVIVAVIAVPLVLMRQSEPTEATEPTTIEQLENEIDALYVTVYGTDEAEGLETKLAKHAEAIADFQAGDCVCPDYSGQIQDINNDLILLRTDLNAVPDYASNITQVNSDLDALSADLVAVETTLTELQAEVDAIAVTDWTPQINALTADISSMESDISTIQGQIASLQSAIDSLPTTLSRYAYVTSLGTKYLGISVTGSGDYPVVVTIYGTALALAEIREVDLVGYDIIYEMAYAENRILTLFIEPDASWGATDTITLVIDEITGGIDYATASVGRGT